MNAFINKKVRLTFGLLASATGLGLVSVQGQTGSFVSGSDGSDGAFVVKGTLPSLEDGAMVYDSARQEIVAYGGSSSETNLTHFSTLIFDGNGWQVASEDVGPGPMSDHVMAYDPGLQETVLVGGVERTNDTEETWIWDGQAWTEVTPANSPPDAFYKAMAYDASRGRVILVLTEGSFDSVLQTWSWDGTEWNREIQMNPPNYFRRLSLFYDPSLEELVLVARNTTSDHDTLTWDGANWNLVVEDRDLEVGGRGLLAYDGNRNAIVYISQSEFDPSLEFDGSDWVTLDNVPEELNERSVNDAIYFPPANLLIAPGGTIRDEEGFPVMRRVTWGWRNDGSLVELTRGTELFDMRDRPNGTWNFTTIDIGPNVVIEFIQNEKNTPVHWLATGDVKIDGILELSGGDRTVGSGLAGSFGFGGVPGPGGHPGGSDYHLWGWEITSLGGGPAEPAAFGSLRSPVLFPLAGGSGRSGGFERGGGGGGAIQIASSGEITLNGKIFAKSAYNNVVRVEHKGENGSVLLRANRISGDGTVEVRGDFNPDDGWIRLEAWEFAPDFSITRNGRSSLGYPLLPTDTLASPPEVTIASVAGVNITDPLPSEQSLLDPDVLVSASGTVEVIVQAANVPDGSPVVLRMTGVNDTVIVSDPVPLSGGQAAFNVDLPEGLGSMKATVSYPYEP